MHSFKKKIMPIHQVTINPPDWPQSHNNSIMDEPPPEWTPQEQPYNAVVTMLPDHCRTSISTLSSSHDICRICHCEGDKDAPLLAPCYCSGSLRYVHQACLQRWIKASDTRVCELCKFTFIMHAKTKPFSEWEKLQMSSIEVRKLWCAVAFHAIAALCVTWSLYILVERTVEEARSGFVDWGFYMKLIIVAIGSTGGIVFMYIQCKTYSMLCRRWRAFNRVIFIQNAPKKTVLPPSPADSLREISVPLKESAIPLVQTADPPGASHNSAKQQNTPTCQIQDTQLKVYVFDKLPLSTEDN